MNILSFLRPYPVAMVVAAELMASAAATAVGVEHSLSC